MQHHPEWGGALAGFFRRRLAQTESDTERDTLQRQLAQFAGNTAIQNLLARTAEETSSKSSSLTALRAMARSALKEMPPAWAATLGRLTAVRDPDIIAEAIAVARSLPVSERIAPAMSRALLTVSRHRTLPAQIRLEALAAVPGGLTRVDAQLFDFLRSGLAPSQPAAHRTAAAAVFEKARLTPAQLQVLTGSLKDAHPLELPRLLRAFSQADDEAVGLRLLDILKQSRAISSLRPDMLLPHLEKYPESVRRQAFGLLASLDMDPARQKAHLEELLAGLQDGDRRRGQAVFNGEKAACSTCHAIGYLGGKLGPDLTRIGQIRTEQDLLEAMIYPDASFVRSYEPVVVVTQAGDIHNGIVREDASDEVLLATGAEQEVRIPRAEIAEMRPGTVSLMPGGLEEQLSRQELADLLAFLKAMKR